MRPLSRFATAALFVAAVAAPLAAQGPTASSRRLAAGLRGQVFDSLVTEGPLVGAEVFLEGTASMVRTDAKGQYAFTGLPAGEYTVGFAHPALDSIGVTLPTRVVTLTAGSTNIVPLSTPALATIFPRLCRAPLPEKSGLVIGRVLDADADTAVAGVTVQAEWMAMILQRGLTPRNTLQRAQAVSDESGRFFLCGVPTDVPVAVRAGRDERFGSIVQLEMDGRGVALRNLAVSLGDLAAAPPPAAAADSAAAADPVAAAGTAMIAGVVTDAKGGPIFSADVRVIGAPVPAAKTNESGSYQLAGLPAGTATVEVRALGFGAYRTITELRRGRTTTLDFTINQQAVQLDPVSVTGYSTLFDRSGFEERRKGGSGAYITEEDIRRRNAVRIEDVFRGIPSVQLTPVGLGGFAVIIPRAASQFGSQPCYPVYYVDGSRFTGLDPQISGGLPIPPEDVRGIEIYASLAGVPVQYSPADGGCGVILVWTKRGAPNRTFDREE